MLKIKNLHARVEDHEILAPNLEIVLERPRYYVLNGSGKSTLASVLSGREDYEVTEGRWILTASTY